MPESPMLTEKAIEAARAHRNFSDWHAEAGLRAFLAAQDPEALADRYDTEHFESELAPAARDLLFHYTAWLLEGGIPSLWEDAAVRRSGPSDHA